MVNLKNEFAWSKSRDAVLQECPRRYWFTYYGSWNGWSTADPRTREIYMLKKLRNRWGWVGERVHGQAKLIVREPQSNSCQNLLDQLRADFRLSKAKAYRENPKLFGLVEHEYDEKIKAEEWKRLADLGRSCLYNLLKSDVLKEVRNSKVLESEEFSSFPVNGVKVHTVMDVAHEYRGGVRVLDWKTGKDQAQEVTLQLACYGLYAAHRWKLPIEKIAVAEYNLPTGKLTQFQMTKRDAGWALDEISAGIKRMAAYLDPDAVQENVPLPEARFERNTRYSRFCPFRRVCHEELLHPALPEVR
jgi:hypothetical protein